MVKRHQDSARASMEAFLQLQDFDLGILRVYVRDYAPMPPANAHVYSNNVRGKRSLGWPAPADCPARLIACSLQATRGDYAQIWGSSGFCLLGHERKGPIVLSPIPTREWRCRQKVRHSMASLNHFLGILLAVNTFEQAQLLQLTSALSTIQGFQIVFAPQW
jgi:hypothetical protein